MLFAGLLFDVIDRVGKAVMRLHELVDFYRGYGGPQPTAAHFVQFAQIQFTRFAVRVHVIYRLAV